MNRVFRGRKTRDASYQIYGHEIRKCDERCPMPSANQPPAQSRVTTEKIIFSENYLRKISPSLSREGADFSVRLRRREFQA